MIVESFVASCSYMPCKNVLITPICLKAVAA